MATRLKAKRKRPEAVKALPEAEKAAQKQAEEQAQAHSHFGPKADGEQGKDAPF